MSKKSGPAAPPPPDPVATAAAQSQYNKEAAVAQANLNRIDQVTPEGTVKYTQIGTNSDGTPQYQQTQTLSPEQQALYTQQNAIAQALGKTATAQIGRVDATMGKAFDFNGMTPMVSTIPGAGSGVKSFSGKMPGVDRSVTGGRIATSYDTGGNIVRSFAQPGSLDTDANGGYIQRGVGPNDFSADAQRVAGAVFGQAASRLDPQFKQGQDDLTARLANQGIAVGSDAYNREQGNFDRARTDAYNDANFRAIQAGGGEQSRLFGLDLSKGQFTNAAQQQAYGQDYSNANLNNAAMGQIFGQNIGTAQFGNQAQAQAYAQSQARAQFGNQAQDQAFTQGMGNAELYNNSGQMWLQQQLSALGFNNQADSQKFNEQLTNANLTNNARQQQIAEATYLRNQPLNDIASLLGTGGGVQQPNFTPFAQVGVAAPDYQGGVQNNYNAAMNQYTQQQAARSQMLGSIFGMAGTLGAAAIPSDRALIEIIVRIGTLANGLATYAYNYIGDTIRRFGVMAQDVLMVRPDAIVPMVGGYMAVDYRKVW